MLFLLCVRMYTVNMHNWLLISVAHDNSSFRFGQCFLTLIPYPIFFLLCSAFQVSQCCLFAEQKEGTNCHYLVIRPIA
jgi:hypothetical protein